MPRGDGVPHLAIQGLSDASGLLMRSSLKDIGGVSRPGCRAQQRKGARAMILRVMRVLGLWYCWLRGLHLQQYLGADFRSVPTMGPQFLLNAIGSGTA
jgi:hypothetical protein